MDYQLMHKEIPVVDFVLDEVTASILHIGTIHNAAHLPIGIPVRKGNVDRAALNAWWQGRSIPASRQRIRQALEELNVSAPQNLLEKCLGLSLSDQYWIRPANSNVRWADVNFFDHPFSDDVGNILIGKGSSSAQLDLMSPDNTSDGWLRKKWSIIDGKRCLLKGGSGATQQEPYNEVFASMLMECLGIPHVEYTISIQDDYPFSVCEDFVTSETELVSAWYIMQTKKKENHTSIFQHFLNCCDALGIPNVREAIDQMLVIDYLIVNEDRHQNNFGLLRNANTLQWIGPAPVYDSGTSLWFDTPTPLINPAAPRITSKPFKTSHDEQVKLVTNFDWIDWSVLEDIGDMFRGVVTGSSFVGETRCSAISHALQRSVILLKEHAKRTIIHSHTTAFDVNQDISYSRDN